MAPMVSRAQLVADGQTNTLNGVSTNLSGGVIVGTNGAFTLLILTNGATVTNTSGNSIISDNAAAHTNQVVVTGAGSSWNNGPGSFLVGESGTVAELDVLNGASVSDGNAQIGGTSGSVSNLALVSGAGSLWTNSSGLIVGNGGAGNSLIVSNGGEVFSSSGMVGESNPQSSNNRVIITGAGSTWTGGGYIYVGSESGTNNQIDINNGGLLVAGSLNISSYGNSNLFTVTDPGSAVQCGTFFIGNSSTGDVGVISNGATMAVSATSLSSEILGIRTTMILTGTNTLWTNAGSIQVGATSNVLFILNGAELVDTYGTIEGDSSSTNTVIVAGPQALWKNLNDLQIDNARIQLLITNGGTVIDQNAYIGNGSGNTNCFALVSGSGSLWTNQSSLYVGNAGGNCELMITNSGAVFAPTIYIGNNSSGNQLVVAGAGTVSVTTLYLGEAGVQNQMTVSNGGVASVNFLSLGSTGIQNDTNTLTITAGTLTVTNLLELYGYGNVTLNSGTLKLNTLDLVGNNCRLVLNGGTLQVASTSDEVNTAPFVVGDGVDAATLSLLNTGTHSFSGGLVVTNNGLFTGAGTVYGNVTIDSGGTFAPGSSNVIYTTLANNLTLNNGCTMSLGLKPQNNSAYYVQGMSNVVYGGTLQLTNLGGIYAAGQSYRLFGANQYSGAFSNVVPSTPGANLRWDTSELTVDGVLRIFSNVTPRPAFRGVIQTNGSVVCTATNGIPYDPCYLYTTTNLPASTGIWTCLVTNHFDVNGMASFTNLVQPGQPQQFFRLQVN